MNVIDGQAGLVIYSSLIFYSLTIDNILNIVVLLILAGITITMLFGENGIIKKAQEASNSMNEAQQNDLEAIGELNNWIGNYTGGNAKNEPVTNPYDPDGWIMAWTCTNGTWSDTISNGETAEGDIVAKLYTTGNKITPPYTYVNGIQTGCLFPEGDEYKLVIEGQGDMGLLMITADDLTPTEAYAWQYSSLLFLGGYSDTCIMPYVTELIVCDGITNIGDYAFIVGVSLKEVKLGKSIKTIGQFAINSCISLESIIIPDGVTEIGRNVFYGCTNLVNLTIPDSVTSIGVQAFGDTRLINITIPNSMTIISDSMFVDCTCLARVIIPSGVTKIEGGAFSGCTNLEKVKIITTKLDTVENYAFDNIAENSVIYVLSEEIKAKLEGTYDSTKTTIQVVTEEEMNQI